MTPKRRGTLGFTQVNGGKLSLIDEGGHCEKQACPPMQPISAAWARSAATLPRATYRTMRVVSAPKARKRRKFIMQAFSEFDLPFFWVD
jgi:hypothetical protein